MTIGSGCKDVTEDLLKVSAILELVHVATLVHDDVLNERKVIREVDIEVPTSKGLHNLSSTSSAGCS